MLYLDKEGSDHRPTLTYLAAADVDFRGISFFDKRWLSRPEIREVVRQGWEYTHTNQNKTLANRLASCRKALSRWKRNTNRNSGSLIQDLSREFEIESSKMYPNFHKLSSLR